MWNDFSKIQPQLGKIVILNDNNISSIKIVLLKSEFIGNNTIKYDYYFIDRESNPYLRGMHEWYCILSKQYNRMWKYEEHIKIELEWI